MFSFPLVSASFRQYLPPNYHWRVRVRFGTSSAVCPGRSPSSRRRKRGVGVAGRVPCVRGCRRPSRRLGALTAHSRGCCRLPSSVRRTSGPPIFPATKRKRRPGRGSGSALVCKSVGGLPTLAASVVWFRRAVASRSPRPARWRLSLQTMPPPFFYGCCYPNWIP